MQEKLGNTIESVSGKEEDLNIGVQHTFRKDCGLDCQTSPKSTSKNCVLLTDSESEILELGSTSRV